MTLHRSDKEFRHPGISYLDYKQMEMDRVLTGFLPRLWWDGRSSIVSRSADLDVDDFVDTLREHPESFAGFDPTPPAAGSRPTCWTWSTGARRRRPWRVCVPCTVSPTGSGTRAGRAYGADEQLYEMISHASDPRRGLRTLEHLKNFFLTGWTSAPKRRCRTLISTWRRRR